MQFTLFFWSDPLRGGGGGGARQVIAVVTPRALIDVERIFYVSLSFDKHI